MKSLTHHLRNVFIFIFAFTIPHLVFADELTNPESTVHNFYSAYLKDDTVDNDAAVKKYVSDELIKSINDSTMCNYDSDDSASASELKKKCSQKHECKQEKVNYICNWYGVWVESDVNYFTKSQDIYPSWKLNINTSVIKKDGNNSVVGVVLGDGSEPKNKLKISLKKSNGSWKIISVTELRD